MSNGHSPLTLAVGRKNIQCVRHLLQHGADPSITDKYGIGPLYIAIRLENITMMKLLLEKNSPIYYEDRARKDFSPIFMVIRENNMKMIKLILEYTDLG